MPKELAKQYAPQGTEDRIYQNWCDKGYFHTQIDRSKKPFTIVMPPPNVTGQLHMGHAMDETWQDILTRYKRMQGYAALWVPGTDHASIATEAKVVAKMREEGLTKEMVGRDGFLERAWDWKNTYGNRIVSQLKKLGCSCDWQRERFTMDEGCSDAVKEVFVRLYNEGLIYRGNRMVNWCPHCNTSISDAEVEYEAKEGSFWHLLYPVKETGEMLELATTRPETMLGDTAVAINAEDPRYKHLHGCHVVLPLLGREIPIVCDEHADMEKGTGVVKITPAHDPNDFEVGKRHDLPMIRVLTYDGHMTGAADKAAVDAEKAAGRAAADEPERGVRGRVATNVSTRRRITDGWMSASPAATTRMAAAMSSGSASLSRKPLAPAESASYTYSSMSNVVSTSTRTDESRGSLRMSRVASMPFFTGMRTSMSTTSGRRARAASTASSPLRASPTTASPS